MKTKKLYAAMMTYEVSDKEKMLAEKALNLFDYLLKSLKKANNHLDLIQTPFKNNSNISMDDIFTARTALRRYRDTVIENFNDFKEIAFKCVIALQYFDSDTQTIKLKKSFILAISDLEKQVNRFVDLFSDLKTNDFGELIIKSINNIKKEIAQLNQIIDDRIKHHLQTNILARNWVDNVSGLLQYKVEEKTPLVVELVQERQKQIDEILQNK